MRAIIAVSMMVLPLAAQADELDTLCRQGATKLALQIEREGQCWPQPLIRNAVCRCPSDTGDLRGQLPADCYSSFTIYYEECRISRSSG